MAVLTKEVAIRWSNINKSHFVEKGYTFTKNNDIFIVKVEDLTKHSTARIDVVCDNCGKQSNMSYDNYNNKSLNEKYYCRLCKYKLNLTIRKITSFKQWCESNLSKSECDKLLSRWDTDKNKCSPDTVSFATNISYYFKCPDHSEHDSEPKSLNSFVYGNNSMSCSQCDTIYYKRPDLIQYFVNKDDCKKYRVYTKTIARLKCPNCDYEKESSIYNLSTKGFACPRCSDGQSYPNKFAFNFLSQLSVKFIKEYRPIWAEGRQYDYYFELNDKSYVLEMDGEFHYVGCKLNGQTKEDVGMIDKWKDMMAYKNNIQPIRIDSRESQLSYIKSSILRSDLSKLFNLSIIDWNECHKYSVNSLVKEACLLWNEYKNMRQISRELCISYDAVQDYIKKGADIGLCDYQTHFTYKKIICLETKEVFESKGSAARVYNVGETNIRNCLEGKRPSACKDLITGEKLHWMYYEDYIKQNNIKETGVVLYSDNPF